MTRWIYVPRVHAYVDARDIISQSLDTNIGRDIIANLEVSYENLHRERRYPPLDI